MKLWTRFLLGATSVALFAFAPAQTAHVHVDLAKPLATVPKTAYGLGVAVWDDHMMDSAVPDLIRGLGVSIVRYPGGSYADLYHWRTASATKGWESATIRPGTDFDAFMGLCRKARTTPLITVDYGSNPEGAGGADPQEAADWVRYANRTKHYGVKYWEIGNEVYGNGFYNGRGWEIDLHAPDTHKPEDRLKNPKLGPVAYGENVNAFVRAMKAQDPSVKVGAVLCGPGHWPDAVDPDWNSNVLKTCGANIDFVVVHWYGEGRSPEEVLGSVRTIPGMVAKLRQEIDQYCGPNAKRVGIWMTEGDASGYNTRQPGALFAADEFLTWIESGADHVDWWDLHNGAGKAFDGVLDDQGILSNGSSAGDQHEPPVNTPFPPYYGLQLAAQVARPGDRFLAATSDSKSLIVHAVRRRDGRLALLLVNEDPNLPIEASIDVKARGGVVFEQGLGQAPLKTRYSGPTSPVRLTVPASSIAALILD